MHALEVIILRNAKAAGREAFLKPENGKDITINALEDESRLDEVDMRIADAAFRAFNRAARGK